MEWAQQTCHTLNTQGSHEGVTLNEPPSPAPKSDASLGSYTASRSAGHPLTSSPLAFQLGLQALPAHLPWSSSSLKGLHIWLNLWHNAPASLLFLFWD